MDKPYDWLLHEWLVEKMNFQAEDKVSMIDVGAYHGDFTEALLATQKLKKSHLFEPNPAHYRYLKNKFSTIENICLYPFALGNNIGSQQFNCSQADATGSLLPYHPKYHHDSIEKINTFSVDVTKLDHFYAEHFSEERIGLIKIDTQGYDLEVLKGAEKIN